VDAPERIGMSNAKPLAGIRVLTLEQFGAGPYGTMFMAELGAEVIKVEGIGEGDWARTLGVHYGSHSAFSIIGNMGKRSLSVDLKSEAGKGVVWRLLKDADIFLEGFRPGVIKRLGFDYEAVSVRVPRLLYVSISGFGQTGPLARDPGHDLNYVARSGMLALSVNEQNVPVMPAGAVGDVGGASLPAFANIMLALYARRDSGKGCFLDIAMSENTLAWMPRALGYGMLGQPMPPASEGRHTGGSPRYGVYVCSDGVPLSCAPIEQPFWDRFCELIDLPSEMHDDSKNTKAIIRKVREIIASRDSTHWLKVFDGEDVCVGLIQDAAAALTDPHYLARGVWDRKLRLHNGRVIPALPVPLSRQLLDPEPNTYPKLGEHAPTDADIWERARMTP